MPRRGDALLRAEFLPALEDGDGDQDSQDDVVALHGYSLVDGLWPTVEGQETQTAEDPEDEK